MRLGVSPDMVTIVGTVGVVVGALGVLPERSPVARRRGDHRLRVLRPDRRLHGTHARGVVEVGLVPRLDARPARRRPIFAGLAIWLFEGGDDHILGYVALWALVMGSVTSYTRAKAESLGINAKGGIAERADRLVASSCSRSSPTCSTCRSCLRSCCGRWRREHGDGDPADGPGTAAGVGRDRAPAVTMSAVTSRVVNGQP